jgi:hypothetical protein
MSSQRPDFSASAKQRWTSCVSVEAVLPVIVSSVLSGSRLYEAPFNDRRKLTTAGPCLPLLSGPVIDSTFAGG